MDVGGSLKRGANHECGMMKGGTKQPNYNVKVINIINLVSICLLLISKKSDFIDSCMMVKDPNKQ